MCLACFIARHGFEPEMGDGCTHFAPGVCSCGREAILFHLNEEFV